MKHMFNIIDTGNIDWSSFKGIVYNSVIPNKKSVIITIEALASRQVYLENNIPLEPFQSNERLSQGDNRENLINYIFPMVNAYELAPVLFSEVDRKRYLANDHLYNYSLPEKVFKLFDTERKSLSSQKAQEERKRTDELERTKRINELKAQSDVEENERQILIEKECSQTFTDWYGKRVVDGSLPSVKETRGLETFMCYLQVHEDKSSTLFINNKWNIHLSKDEYDKKYKQLSIALFGKVEGIRDTRFDKNILPEPLSRGIKNIFLLIFWGAMLWILFQVLGSWNSPVLRP